MLSILKKMPLFIFSLFLTMGETYGSTDFLELQVTPEGAPKARGQIGGEGALNYRHIEKEDRDLLQSLPSSQKSKFPQSIEKWFDNLLVRQKTNPYSALIFFKNSELVAVVGFGIMPHLGYDPKHRDIIDFYIEKGVIRRKSGSYENSYQQNDLEEVLSYGIGMMLPLLREGITQEEANSVIQGSFKMFKSLKQEFYLLPRNNKKPKFFMGLLAKQDPFYDILRSAYLKAGFKQEDRPGFNGFFDDDRSLFHHDMTGSDTPKISRRG